MALKFAFFACLLASMHVLVSCAAYSQFIGGSHHKHGYRQGFAKSASPIVQAIPVGQQGFINGQVPVQVAQPGYNQGFVPVQSLQQGYNQGYPGQSLQQGYNQGYSGQQFVSGGYYPRRGDLLENANHFVKKNWPLLLAGGAAIAIARG